MPLLHGALEKNGQSLTVIDHVTFAPCTLRLIVIMMLFLPPPQIPEKNRYRLVQDDNEKEGLLIAMFKIIPIASRNKGILLTSQNLQSSNFYRKYGLYSKPTIIIDTRVVISQLLAL